MTPTMEVSRQAHGRLPRGMRRHIRRMKAAKERDRIARLAANHPVNLAARHALEERERAEREERERREQQRLENERRKREGEEQARRDAAMWVCHAPHWYHPERECGHRNPEHSIQCADCFRSKGTPFIDPQVWTCQAPRPINRLEICGYENKGPICVLCCAAKPTTQPVATAAAGGEPTTSDKGRPHDWTCERCGAGNGRRDDYCYRSSCGQPAPWQQGDHLLDPL